MKARGADGKYWRAGTATTESQGGLLDAPPL